MVSYQVEEAYVVYRLYYGPHPATPIIPILQSSTFHTLTSIGGGAECQVLEYLLIFKGIIRLKRGRAVFLTY